MVLDKFENLYTSARESEYETAYLIRKVYKNIDYIIIFFNLKGHHSTVAPQIFTFERERFEMTKNLYTA